MSNTQPFAFHYQRGMNLQREGKFAESIPHLLAAIQVEPAAPQAAFYLAEAYRNCDDLVNAERWYRHALTIKPAFREALNNLAGVMQLWGQFAAAIALYEQLLAEHCDDASALNNLGCVHQARGDWQSARACFGEVARLRSNSTLAQLRPHIISPVVFANVADIDHYRDELLGAVVECSRTLSTCQPQQLMSSGCVPPHELYYHNRDERPIREAFGRMFSSALSRTDAPIPSSKSAPRLAVIVTRGNERIFLRSAYDALRAIDPRKVEVTFAVSSCQVDWLRQEALGGHASFLPLLDNFEDSVETLREARFNIIYHWEIGTDVWNYTFPFLNLAPVQCTGIGIPATSGIPAVDYYLSSRWTEPDIGDSHYSEKLVRLSTLPSVTRHPPLDTVRVDRRKFGWTESDHVYACLQNPAKFHPEFDQLLGMILRQDPAGRLILLGDRGPQVMDALLRRFDRTLADVLDRITVLPALREEVYFQLIKSADVILDTIHYSGVNTSCDALAMAKPVVTWPGVYQRSRYTYGCYLAMEYLECVTWSSEAYARQAVQLGTDITYRTNVSREIQNRQAVLFDIGSVSREYERAFLEMASQSANTSAHAGAPPP